MTAYITSISIRDIHVKCRGKIFSKKGEKKCAWKVGGGEAVSIVFGKITMYLLDMSV